MYISIQIQKYKKVPEGLTDEEAILLGDILSTAFFCVDQGLGVLGGGGVGFWGVGVDSSSRSRSSSKSKSNEGSNGSAAAANEQERKRECVVVVCGCGPVGLLAVLAAQQRGATKVCFLFLWFCFDTNTCISFFVHCCSIIDHNNLHANNEGYRSRWCRSTPPESTCIRRYGCRGYTRRTSSSSSRNHHF